MAAQEKIVSSTGSDLDVLIHSLEYENQQYVKMIEKENQRNAYLESQEEEKLRVIADLHTQVASLEADTKNNHKQLVHNKNTLESLKKSKCVLQAHKDALLKRLDTVQIENNEQWRELEDAVQLYEKTWIDYEAQYRSLGLYQQLLEEEQRLEQSQAEHTKWQQKKSLLQTEITRAQDELDFREWYRFCIKIAEKWVMIGQKKEELLDGVREKETLQSKLKEIREKNASALGTSHDSAQDMDMESSLTESWEREDQSLTEGDLTLVAGDGGDTGGVEAEKENVGTEQRQEWGGTETRLQVLASNQTFTIPETLGTTVPALGSTPAVRVNPVVEEMMEEDGGKTRELRPPVDMDRFEPSDTSSPVVTGPRCGTRRPLQPLQLTSTPRITYRPPNLAVPKISLGVHGRYSPRLPSSVPQIMELPRKVIATTVGIARGVPAAVPQSRPLPPQLSVPCLTIPRPPTPTTFPRPPTPFPRPPTPASSPHIPTVRSAVSSLLSGARSAAERLSRPPAPRIQLPRTPLLAPPPSPILSRFSRPLERGSSGGDMSQSVQGRPVSVLSVAVPTLGEQRQGFGRKSNSSDPTGPGVDIPISASHIGGSFLRPSGQQTASASFGANTVLHGSAELRQLTTPGAGDAPPAQPHGKVEPASDKHAATDNNSAKQVVQDEEMDSDTDSRGLSQTFSGSQLSEGAMSQGHDSHLSQGHSNAYSPFSLDKHKQKLLEINEDSEDSFNFEQRHLFRSNDKMEEQPVQGTTSASSIFNLAFVTSPTVSSEPPLAPLFKDVTTPSAPCPGPTPTDQPPVNRDSERSGSFFSFEAMDTSEADAGLSLLSVFGNTGTQPEPDSAFSFAFGDNSPNSGNSAPFPFSFGGGGGGGGNEQSSGSLFSLF